MGTAPRRFGPPVFSLAPFMQPSDQHPTLRPSDRCARFVQRQILWLLVGCYALATFWPHPGLLMRHWEWSPEIAGQVPLSLPLLLLALLLFCAALGTDVAQMRTVVSRPGVLIVGLLAVWAGPMLLVAVAGAVVPWAVDGQATFGLLVGLALVATMPVANSSVGWTQSAGGNLALSLGLVLLSISICPWATPNLLGLLGLSLSQDERALCEALVNQFSGAFFIVWVILPTAAGLTIRLIAGDERLAKVAGWISLASAASLLLLNYVNAALALPKVWQQSNAAVLITTFSLAIAMSVVGLAVGWALARLMRLPDKERFALLFGLSMKHTGLALLLAGAVLTEQPLAILIIVLATVAQHLSAGIVQWSSLRRADEAAA
jgi:BASS family bile acid:Na+ symporter